MGAAASVEHLKRLCRPDPTRPKKGSSSYSSRENSYSTRINIFIIIYVYIDRLPPLPPTSRTWGLDAWMPGCSDACQMSYLASPWVRELWFEGQGGWFVWPWGYIWAPLGYIWAPMGSIFLSCAHFGAGPWSPWATCWRKPGKRYPKWAKWGPKVGTFSTIFWVFAESD